MKVLRVLLVDDNPGCLTLGRMALTRRGHAVTLASSGAAAVRLAAAQPFDVLVLDLRLPDGDGFELLTRLRAQQGDPGSPSARSVAVTADVMRQTRACVLARGFDEYVTKPFTLAELVRAVEAVGD